MVITRLEDAIESVPSNYSPEYLRSSIDAELDKIGNGDQRPDEERLLKVLRDWSRDRSSTLPSCLLFPVEPEFGVENDDYIDNEEDGDGMSPGLSFLQAVEREACGRPGQAGGIKHLNKRDRAIAVLLRKLSRDGEFEVFLTKPSSGFPSSQEQERRVYGSCSRDYMDVTGRLIFEHFWLHHEGTPLSDQVDCHVALTIVPWRRLFIDLMERTAEDDPHIDIMCYFLHRAVDRGSIELTFCCNEYGNLCGYHWPRPAQVLEKWLLSSVFFAEYEEFDLQTMGYHREPSPRFFRQLRSAFKFTEQTATMDRYEDGLDLLLAKVSGENIADALSQLEDPDDVANNRQGYVARWIDLHLDASIDADKGRSLDIKEAQMVVDICARFQKAFNMAGQLSSIIYYRAQNSRFCLKVVLQIFEKLISGDISAELARASYQPFRRHAMNDVVVLEIMGFALHSEYRGRIKTDRTMKTEDIAPMEADGICRAFSEMVNRGWDEEAVEFLQKMIVEPMRLDDLYRPAHLFHTLWFPFLVHAMDDYRDGDSPQWQAMGPMLKDSLMSVLLTYAAYIVGPEPKKSGLGREDLPKDCDCFSCKIIDSFLVNRRKTRQIFKIVKSIVKWSFPAVHGFCIPRPDLSHIIRRLDHPDCDCSFHVRDSRAAGPVLVIQKRPSQRVWDKWKERKDEGRKRLAPIFGTKFFRDMMGGEAKYEEWEELRFLERGYGGEVRSPFMTKHPQEDVNEVLLIVKMLAAQRLWPSGPGYAHKPGGPALQWVG